MSKEVEEELKTIQRHFENISEEKLNSNLEKCGIVDLTKKNAIQKLEAIKVCGDKGIIWNFEAGIILDYIEDLEEDKEELKRKIRVKKQEHEHLRDFYKINTQGYSFGKEVEIIKEYEELLEEE